jgi:hypothetical protein
MQEVRFMKMPCKFPSHKTIPKFYHSNPYEDFASFQYVMPTWDANIYKVKKS